MWNWHSCMTLAQRVAALVPRMNEALHAARRLGMQVMWAPSGAASQYAGWPQRERAIGLPPYPVPNLREVSCVFGARKAPCCGPGITCLTDQGCDGMEPALTIAADDWIVEGPQELYSIYKERGLRHLLYMGVATNESLFGNPEAIKAMASAGLDCLVARDLTEAETRYDPETRYTPDLGTAESVADLERAGFPTIDLAEEMRKCGQWKDAGPLERVHVSPWGTTDRPHLFTGAVTVMLKAVRLGQVEIRYTLDGSVPGAQSPLYREPLQVDRTTLIQAAAFVGGRKVSLLSEGYFAQLGPLPPKPDIYLDQIQRLSQPPWVREPIWQPKINLAFNGGALTIRKRTYQRGVGVTAPDHMLYAVQPAYDRFVALAGVDDDPFRQSPEARFLARHCSVRFQVYIDGKLAAESPVMRLSQEPWRFDVRIPQGSRRIHLVSTDAGTRSLLDLGDWVDAGFIMKK